MGVLSGRSKERFEGIVVRGEVMRMVTVCEEGRDAEEDMVDEAHGRFEMWVVRADPV